MIKKSARRTMTNAVKQRTKRKIRTIVTSINDLNEHVYKNKARAFVNTPSPFDSSQHMQGKLAYFQSCSCLYGLFYSR